MGDTQGAHSCGKIAAVGATIAPANRGRYRWNIHYQRRDYYAPRNCSGKVRLDINRAKPTVACHPEFRLLILGATETNIVIYAGRVKEAPKAGPSKGCEIAP